MDTTAATPLSVYTRLQRSCTECRRRKQKCNPSPIPGTQCSNCAKRWPPVQCVFQQPAGNKKGHASLQSVFVFQSSKDGAKRSGSSRGRTRTTPSVSAPAASPPLPSPRSPVGGVLTEIHCMESHPIEKTARNAELMDFFIGYVSPNLVSIDGKDTPEVYQTLMLPWMLQSPMFPKIALLMASLAQTLEMGRQTANGAEPYVLKAKVLNMMNSAVGGGQHDKVDIWRCIIHLVVTEWFWGDDRSMWAHLRGLRDLVAARGGLWALNDPLFQSVLILADYAIACCFEQDLCVQDAKTSSQLALPVPPNYSEYLACPLRENAKSFVELQDALSLSPESAKLLDDIRSLTTSITSPPTDGDDTKDARDANIKPTASVIHKRLVETLRAPASSNKGKAPEDDTALITEAIHLAALLYTESIATGQPITKIKSTASVPLPTPQRQSSPDLDPDRSTRLERRLHSLITEVNPPRWKMIPGIFLWIMLVAVAQETTTPPAITLTSSNPSPTKTKPKTKDKDTSASASGHHEPSSSSSPDPSGTGLQTISATPETGDTDDHHDNDNDNDINNEEETREEEEEEQEREEEKEKQKKFLRRKMAAAAQAVGQEEFGLSIAYLRAFWLVQRWVVDVRDGRRGDKGGDRDVDGQGGKEGGGCDDNGGDEGKGLEKGTNVSMAVAVDEGLGRNKGRGEGGGNVLYEGRRETAGD